MSALRALIAAMPDIAHALEAFIDPDLKLRAFDALIQAALDEARSGAHTAYSNGETALMARITDGPSYSPLRNQP